MDKTDIARFARKLSVMQDDIYDIILHLHKVWPNWDISDDVYKFQFFLRKAMDNLHEAANMLECIPTKD